MLKGITLIVLFLGTEMCPFATSASRTFVCSKDSVTTHQIQIGISSPATEIKKHEKTQYNPHQLDSIFLKSDRREQVIRWQKKVMRKSDVVTQDSTIKLNFDIPYFQRNNVFDSRCNENFLANIGLKSFSQHFDTVSPKRIVLQKVVKPKLEADSVKNSLVNVVTGFKGNARKNYYVSWLPVVLLVSLFTFALIKMQYKRYLDQLITALINYQVSLRLLRERNVLFRNMSFGMNLVFGLNLGLFIFFILQIENIKQPFTENILNVLIYSGSLMIIYAFKSFICKVIGYLFKVQTEFLEYVHNINLFNKNIGLFLFPIVIAFPYIDESMKKIVIYIGISILFIMFFLRTVRSVQIIMRKGVSLFYLILYLCAIEILPVLILVKYSSTLV